MLPQYARNTKGFKVVNSLLLTGAEIPFIEELIFIF
jgi:hypothetical protein